MSAEKDKKAIPTRIPAAFLPRIDAAAQKMGSNRAQLIAFCVRSFVEDFDEKGFCILPLNWREILKSWDGRTSQAKFNVKMRFPPSQKVAARLNDKNSAVNSKAIETNRIP